MCPCMVHALLGYLCASGDGALPRLICVDSRNDGTYHPHGCICAGNLLVCCGWPCYRLWSYCIAASAQMCIYLLAIYGQDRGFLLSSIETLRLRDIS